MRDYETVPEAVSQPCIRDILDNTQGYLNSAHELLNDIEDRIRGSVPRPVQTGSKENMPAMRPSIRDASEQNSTSASTLQGRLETLLRTL